MCNHIKTNNTGTNYRRLMHFKDFNLESKAHSCYICIPANKEKAHFVLFMAVKSYANPFLCSIFIHVEAEIWKTAQNSIITWFNWATNFTQLFFSPQLWTQWAGCAVYRGLASSSIQATGVFTSLYEVKPFPCFLYYRTPSLTSLVWAQHLNITKTKWSIAAKSLEQMSTNHTLASKWNPIIMKKPVCF